MLLTLAVFSTLKVSVLLYKATKQWRPNHYMQQFVKDGILYFLVYVLLFPFFQFHSLPSYFPSILLSSTCKQINELPGI